MALPTPPGASTEDWGSVATASGTSVDWGSIASAAATLVDWEAVEQADAITSLTQVTLPVNNLFVKLGHDEDRKDGALN